MIKKTLNPKWNASNEFTVILPNENPDDCLLQIEVWDYDWLVKDDYIGRGVLDNLSRWVYVFEQIYIHIYIHTYSLTDIHTYIHTYIRTYIHTCVHTYILTYIHTYIHAYLHTY